MCRLLWRSVCSNDNFCTHSTGRFPCTWRKCESLSSVASLWLLPPATRSRTRRRALWLRLSQFFSWFEHYASRPFQKAITKASQSEKPPICLTESIRFSSPDEFPTPSNATADEVRFCRTVELLNLPLRYCCVGRPTRDNQSRGLFAQRVLLPGSSRPVGEKIRRATECARHHGR